MNGKVLNDHVEQILQSVNLSVAGDRKAMGYSGGMKRRLSVANSLIGDPTVVYMDEPSTGLDPASKHQLWDVISASKAGKSMILTTHSMEEADVLCDRLAIMAGGELQCVGRSWQLERRFGKGYTLGITTKDKSPEFALKIEKYIKGVFPSASLIDDPIGGVSKFEIGREDVVLSEVFTKLNSDMERRSSLSSTRCRCPRRRRPRARACRPPPRRGGAGRWRQRCAAVQHDQVLLQLCGALLFEIAV